MKQFIFIGALLFSASAMAESSKGQRIDNSSANTKHLQADNKANKYRNNRGNKHNNRDRDNRRDDYRSQNHRNDRSRNRHRDKPQRGYQYVGNRHNRGHQPTVVYINQGNPTHWDRYNRHRWGNNDVQLTINFDW